MIIEKEELKRRGEEGYVGLQFAHGSVLLNYKRNECAENSYNHGDL